MQAYGYFGTFDGLPDPEREPAFYDGVLPRRFVAWLFDVCVILAVGVPLALIFGIVTLGFGFMIFPLIVAGVGFLYRWATVAGRSATWGMRFTGIELRRHDGARLDPLSALLHVTIYTVSVAFVVPIAISCIAMMTSRYGQGLSDIALRTTAINRPAD